MYLASTVLAVWGLYDLNIMTEKYNGFVGLNGPRSILLSFILCPLFFGGCSLSASDPTAQLASEDQLITGSVVEQAKPDGVAETDAAIIKNTVIDASTKRDVTHPLAWNNPETGSSGAITSIARFMGKHGQHCRGFKTTVSNYAGISYYNGETCQIDQERWVLSWFKPAD